MTDLNIVIAAMVGLLLGCFIGVSVRQMIYTHSRLKKIQDEFDEDRKRIRAEFEKARNGMSE